MPLEATEGSARDASPPSSQAPRPGCPGSITWPGTRATNAWFAERPEGILTAASSEHSEGPADTRRLSRLPGAEQPRRWTKVLGRYALAAGLTGLLSLRVTLSLQSFNSNSRSPRSSSPLC
jgi:hypothetical protein